MSDLTKQARRQLQYGGPFECRDMDEPWIEAALDCVDQLKKEHPRPVKHCRGCTALKRFERAAKWLN